MLFGEHVPCVCLDLEVGRHRFARLDAKELAKERLRAREWAELLAKERHVKMHPPLFGARVARRGGGERVREIHIAREGVAASRDHLVEIDALGESGEGAQALGVRARDSQARAELNFWYSNPGGGERSNGGGGLLELDGRVARVEAHADVAPENILAAREGHAGDRAELFGGRAREEVALKKIDGLGGGLEEAAGLGLEGEGDHAPGALFNSVEHGRVPDDLPGHFGGVSLGVAGAYARLEAAGHRADAALEITARKEGGQDLGELVCVTEALGVAPIREVYVLFYAAFVELAVRKAVDGEHIEVMPVEEALK